MSALLKSIRAPLQWSILSAEHLEAITISLGFIHQPTYVDVSLTINGITAQYHKNQYGEVFFIPAADQCDSITVPFVVQCQQCPIQPVSHPIPQYGESTSERAAHFTPSDNLNMINAYDPFFSSSVTPIDLSATSPLNDSDGIDQHTNLIVPSSLFHDDERNRVIVQPLPSLFSDEERNQMEAMDIADLIQICEQITELSDPSFFEEERNQVTVEDIADLSNTTSEPHGIFRGETVDAIYLSDVSNDVHSDADSGEWLQANFGGTYSAQHSLFTSDEDAQLFNSNVSLRMTPQNGFQSEDEDQSFSSNASSRMSPQDVAVNDLESEGTIEISDDDDDEDQDRASPDLMEESLYSSPVGNYIDEFLAEEDIDVEHFIPDGYAVGRLLTDDETDSDVTFYISSPEE